MLSAHNRSRTCWWFSLRMITFISRWANNKFNTHWNCNDSGIIDPSNWNRRPVLWDNTCISTEGLELSNERRKEPSALEQVTVTSLLLAAGWLSSHLGPDMNYFLLSMLTTLFLLLLELLIISVWRLDLSRNSPLFLYQQPILTHSRRSRRENSFQPFFKPYFFFSRSTDQLLRLQLTTLSFHRSKIAPRTHFVVQYFVTLVTFMLVWGSFA